MVDPPARRPVVVLGGPTASGKSDLAAAIAERFGGVVINADSMQVYRGLDVLTGAPGAQLRARAPHRLYGVLDPGEPCSAGWWRVRALAEIAAAHAAGRLPVVTGGTGLYLRALTTGLARLPPVSAPIRAALRERVEREGTAALHAELSRRDPASAGRIGRSDTQRIVRALEVLEATGRRLSAWQRGDQGAADVAGLAFCTIVLLPPRAALYAACVARFAAMVQDGALAEVQALAARGLDPTLPAMKALGAADLMRHLAGQIALDEAVRRGQLATRRYVKRQVTWFRHQIIADLILQTELSETESAKIFSFISNFLLTSRR